MGQLFTDDEELHALDSEWVDTPAKFPSIAADVTSDTKETDGWSIARDDMGDVELPKRRGRKPRTEAE